MHPGASRLCAVLMTVCHERTDVEEGLPEAGRQGRASNHRKLRRPRAGVVSFANNDSGSGGRAPLCGSFEALGKQNRDLSHY